MRATERQAARARGESIPPALWVIAVGALTPFPISALCYAFASPEVSRPALTVLLTWSVVTLSFLGGVRWGMETTRPSPRWTRMLISVGSAVAAWALLVLRYRLDDTWIVGGCIAAFLVQWLFDHQGPDVPARYPRLSTVVTGAACVSLAVCLEQTLKI